MSDSESYEDSAAATTITLCYCVQRRMIPRQCDTSQHSQSQSAAKCKSWSRNLLRLPLAGIVLVLLVTLDFVLPAFSWRTDSLPRSTVFISASDEGIRWFSVNSSYVHDHHLRILHSDRETMLIGGRNKLYNFSMSSLKQNSVLSWEARNFDIGECQRRYGAKAECDNFIQLASQRSPSEYFVCGTHAYKPTCRIYLQDGLNFNIIKQSDGTGLIPLNPTHNSTAIFAGGHLYAATVVGFDGRDPLIMDYPTLVRTRQHDSKWLNEPNFVNSIEYGDKVYFFFRETAVENINCGKTVFSRVARVCKNDRGGRLLLNDEWTSFFKTRLNCSIPGEFPFYFNLLQATSEIKQGNYLPMAQSSNISDIIYGVFTTPINSISGSAVCAFRMSDVMQAFEGRFKSQQSIKHNWLPVMPSHQHNPHPEKCMNDSMTISPNKLSFIMAHPLMDQAVSSLGGQPILVKTSFDYQFTQIAIDWQVLADRYYDVMFIGTDDGHVLKAVNKGTDGKIDTVILEEILVFRDNQAVVGLKVHRRPEHGIENLIVVSQNNVVSIPLHRCHLRNTCGGCVALQDPYCSWLDGRCQNTPTGYQSVRNGTHSYCRDIDLNLTTTVNATIENITDSTTTTTTEPPSFCVCTNIDTVLKDGTPEENNTADIDIGNVIRTNSKESPVQNDKKHYPGSDNRIPVDPVYGASMQSDVKFTVQTLAISIVVSIVISIVIGFLVGFKISSCRQQEVITRSLFLDKKPDFWKNPNRLDLEQNQLNHSESYTSMTKQLNLVLNVPPKGSNKLPNSSAETKPVHKANKVYL